MLSLLMVSGDPRMGMRLAWMAGSTYHVRPSDAVAATIVAVSLFFVVPLVSRWLEILQLGETTAREVGVDMAKARRGR